MMPPDRTPSWLLVTPLFGALSYLRRQAQTHPPSDPGLAQVTGEDMELQPSRYTEQVLLAQDRGYAAWSFVSNT